MPIEFNNREIKRALKATRIKWIDNIIRHYFDAYRFNKKFVEFRGDGAIEVLTKDITKIREDISNEKLKGKDKDRELIVQWENSLKVKEKDLTDVVSMKKERDDCLSSALNEEEMLKDIDAILREPKKIYGTKKN